MDRRAELVALAALFACGPASAFVSPSPPAGFGGSPGAWTYTPPTAAQQIGSIMRGPGPRLPSGPATTGAFRLGPGAARALAGGVARGLIPGLGLALGVAWLASNCFEKQGGQWVRTCGVPEVPPVSTGFEYQAVNDTNIGSIWRATPADACARAVYLEQQTWGSSYVVSLNSVDTSNMRCVMRLADAPSGAVYTNSHIVAYQQRQTDCPIGWYITPAGCVQHPALPSVTIEEIEEEMAPKPLPDQLPPGVPYPLAPDAPFIFNPDTGNPPNAQPLRVPQGNPIPIPNTNPQQYRQPVIRYNPAPTADDPFRLDARPEDLISNSPTGMTGPQSVTSGSPSGEKPEQVDLCKEHPDIIACQVFKPDDLTPDPVANKEIPLALNAATGFPTGGSCPQAKSVQLLGQTFSFSMQPLCDLATGIRPLLIGFAWLSAALVFLGVARREN